MWISRFTLKDWWKAFVGLCLIGLVVSIISFFLTTVKVFIIIASIIGGLAVVSAVPLGVATYFKNKSDHDKYAEVAYRDAKNSSIRRINMEIQEERQRHQADSQRFMDELEGKVAHDEYYDRATQRQTRDKQLSDEDWILAHTEK